MIKNSVTLLLVFCVFSLVNAQGVSKTGTTSANFLKMTVGPRTVAMGGAYSLVENDVAAMYWNPGGVAFVNRPSAMFTQTDWIADINLNYLGIVTPMGAGGSIGINVTAVTMDDMEETTEYQPNGTGNKFSAGMYAIGLSCARRLTKNFSIGANLKYIREDIAESSAHGVALDIGTVFTTPFYGVRISTAIRNFGTKMKMNGEDLLFQYDPDENRDGSIDRLNSYIKTNSYDMPLNLQIGLSKDFTYMENQKVTIVTDAALPSDNTQYMNIGAEFAFMRDMVFLRTGYKTLFIRDREEGLTAGAGLKYQSLDAFTFSIDYAVQFFEYLGDVHTFGIYVGF